MMPSRGALAQKTSADCVQIIENTRPKPKKWVWPLTIADFEISLATATINYADSKMCLTYVWAREIERLGPCASRMESDPETAHNHVQNQNKN